MSARTPKTYMRSGQSERPHFRLHQSERDIPAAPIRTRELSSLLTAQRRILTHVGASRSHTHASGNITSKAEFFQYNISPPLLCLWPSCYSPLGLTTSHFNVHRPTGILQVSKPLTFRAQSKDCSINYTGQTSTPWKPRTSGHCKSNLGMDVRPKLAPQIRFCR